ncbi:MAG TPA: hypothetical protein VF598_08610, partial [Hymenobacter sp.]
MKTFFTCLVALLTSAATAQPVPYPGYYQLPVNQETKQVEYTAVVPVANTSKNELFLRAQESLAKLGSNATLTQKVNNPEAG